ncbi:hypothetical protein ACHWQZ_G019120 [Mnemiopsis leidyi]
MNHPVYLLLLPLAFSTTSPSSPPPSTPLDLSIFPETKTVPYGPRLFLTPDQNFLNLVWCCDLPPDARIKQYESRTWATFWYNVATEAGVNRTAANITEVTGRYKNRTTTDNQSWKLGQFNTTIELRFNKTLHYEISCNGVVAGKFKVLYKYWDKHTSQADQWTLLSAGSVGLYNTTHVALNTIRTVAENTNNVIWTIPGGVVSEDGQAENMTELESLRRWRAWIQLAQNVTCCTPVAAAPSELDLLPHRPDNQLHSHFRWFMELPFVSQNQSSEVLWHSFDHRNLHVVSVCTYCNLSDESPQFKWLEEDLKAATSTNNTHWILVMGHDPVYEHEEALHPEVQTAARKQLDKLFAEHKVDFGVWSHERWYERTKPMTNLTVSDDRVSNTLDSVNGTIHFSCGTGGAPLQHYNMEKYNHTARFVAYQYGACGIFRTRDNWYNTMFLTIQSDGRVHELDHFVITKNIPQPQPFIPESHFSKFMKVFGIVIVIGTVIMLLITILIKAVQKHDPSFIPNKIRNVRYRKETHQRDGSSETLQVQETDIEMDIADLPSKKEDKVMLLEEKEETELQLQSAAQMYGVMM